MRRPVNAAQPARTCRSPNFPTANIRGLSSELLSMAVDRTRAQPRALVQVSRSMKEPKAPMKRRRATASNISHPTARSTAGIPCPDIAEINHAGQRAVGRQQNVGRVKVPVEHHRRTSPCVSRTGLRPHRPQLRRLRVALPVYEPFHHCRIAVHQRHPRKGFTGTPTSAGT